MDEKTRTLTLHVRQLRGVLLKLFIAALFIGGAIALFRFGLLPLLGKLLSLGESELAAVRRGGILLCLLLGYWGYVHFAEKRHPTELGIKPGSIALSALLGVAMIALASAVLFACGVYQLNEYRGFNSALFGVAGVILVAATLEEVVFRGVMFQALESAWGTVPALWLQSLIFSVLHIANLDSNLGTPELVVTVISGTLIGAFWTVLFVQSRNIWVVAAHHAAWNFAVLLTGLPLSGLDDWRAVAPLESSYHGPNWLSGGTVGPEDSILTVMLVAAVFTVILLWARKSRRLLPAAPQ